MVILDSWMQEEYFKLESCLFPIPDGQQCVHLKRNISVKRVDYLLSSLLKPPRTPGGKQVMYGKTLQGILWTMTKKEIKVVRKWSMFSPKEIATTTPDSELSVAHRKSKSKIRIYDWWRAPGRSLWRQHKQLAIISPGRKLVNKKGVLLARVSKDRCFTCKCRIKRNATLKDPNKAVWWGKHRDQALKPLMVEVLRKWLVAFIQDDL